MQPNTNQFVNSMNTQGKDFDAVKLYWGVAQAIPCALTILCQYYWMFGPLDLEVSPSQKSEFAKVWSILKPRPSTHSQKTESIHAIQRTNQSKRISTLQLLRGYCPHRSIATSPKGGNNVCRLVPLHTERKWGVWLCQKDLPKVAYVTLDLVYIMKLWEQRQSQERSDNVPLRSTKWTKNKPKASS